MTIALDEVFLALKAIMVPYTKALDIKQDEADNFSIDTFHVMSNGKPLFFGAVQIKKKYANYHLMPVYANPALLNGLSPELKKRMQGKSCFNFKSIDPVLFKELDALTKSGLKDYRNNGYLRRPKT